MDNQIRKIAFRFPVIQQILHIQTYGSGHINDTYKIETNNGDFILQRINTQVFKNVDGLTANFRAVSDFMKKKISVSHEKMMFPELFPAENGKYYFRDAHNQYWRLMSFIPDSRSFDKVENSQMAYKGGKAYGWFIKMLSDFPVDRLVETIPRFHDIDFRLDNFYESLKKDMANRSKSAKKEINTARKYAPLMHRLKNLGQEGKIPVRVTHNDTKINNVLFDSRMEPVAIVDLDTVMPGFVHYDFGDAIRTFTNAALEDEPDLNKVIFLKDYYDAFREGFLSQTQAILNETEIRNLPFSALYMTYIIGLRFLTDYLNGDIYFKTAYDTHNLVRARNQFHLLDQMEKQLKY